MRGRKREFGWVGGEGGGLMVEKEGSEREGESGERKREREKRGKME